MKFVKKNGKYFRVDGQYIQLVPQLNPPTVAENPDYTGSAVSPRLQGFFERYMNKGGITSATEIGDYTMTIGLNSGYKWADGSKDSKSLAWRVNKGPSKMWVFNEPFNNSDYVSFDVEFTSGSLYGDEGTLNYIGIRDLGTSEIEYQTSGTTADVVTDWSGAFARDCYRYIILKEAPTGEFLTWLQAHAVEWEPSSVLNDNPWGAINCISTAKMGNNYWSVGDTKTITINGTVGKTTFSNLSIDCFILGFNHNAAKEGNNRIHFGIGKSGDKLVGLVDSMYDSNVTETGYFSMNASRINVGGWKDCQLRNTVLQGTGTAYRPTANTLLAALSSDLRASIKSITKYTDNIGNGTDSVQSNVTATTDYLFIPANYEIVASGGYANTYEQAQQQQYNYFKNGNSKIAYKYNDTSTVAEWWLRSPGRTGASGFCYVRASTNDMSNGSAYFSQAILPCFCV